MEVLVEELVHVHRAVKKILPRVDNESIRYPIEMRTQLGERRGVDSQREEELCGRNTPPV